MSPLAAVRRQGGLSLIELIIFVVIVSVALVGVLSVLNVTVKSSADPVIRKQALALAEAMLDEILGKDYQNVPRDEQNGVVGGNNAQTPTQGCTPTTTPLCRTNTLVDRQNYNDVDDYDGWNQTGVYRLDGTAVPILANYSVRVAVAAGSGDWAGGKMVTVTVGGGTEQIVLSSFRANF